MKYVIPKSVRAWSTISLVHSHLFYKSVRNQFYRRSSWNLLVLTATITIQTHLSSSNRLPSLFFNLRFTNQSSLFSVYMASWSFAPCSHTYWYIYSIPLLQMSTRAFNITRDLVFSLAWTIPYFSKNWTIVFPLCVKSIIFVVSALAFYRGV